MPVPRLVREKTDGTAAERGSGDWSRTEGGGNGKQLGTEVEKVPLIDETREIEGEGPTKEAVPELCLGFAKIALQPVIGEAKKEVESSIRLVSSKNFDAGSFFGT